MHFGGSLGQNTILKCLDHLSLYSVVARMVKKDKGYHLLTQMPQVPGKSLGGCCRNDVIYLLVLQERLHMPKVIGRRCNRVGTRNPCFCVYATLVSRLMSLNDFSSRTVSRNCS